MKYLLLIAMTILIIPQTSRASGCGSWENFRQILESKTGEPGDARNDYAVISQNSLYVKIALNGVTTPLTLEFDHEVRYAPSPGTNFTNLSVRDLVFTEGNGCGPIYNCATGQYVLRIPDPLTSTIRIYSYPMIDEFYDLSGDTSTGWKADSVLPVFFGLAASGPDSDKKQCTYGNW